MSCLRCPYFRLIILSMTSLYSSTILGVAKACTSPLTTASRIISSPGILDPIDAATLDSICPWKHRTHWWSLPVTSAIRVFFTRWGRLSTMKSNRAPRTAGSSTSCVMAKTYGQPCRLQSTQISKDCYAAGDGYIIDCAINLLTDAQQRYQVSYNQQQERSEDDRGGR